MRFARVPEGGCQGVAMRFAMVPGVVARVLLGYTGVVAMVLLRCR